MRGDDRVRKIILATAIVGFVVVGGAVWVVALSDASSLIAVIFDPAYVFVALVAVSISGVAYWVGDQLGLGE